MGGPVTTLPLPHHVHDTVKGWLQTRPKYSPMIPVQFSVDRPAYSSLGVNLPRFSNNGHNPGRYNQKSAIADTGAQLTIVPLILLQNLKVKPETIFPLQTKVNGASSVPIMVEGGILLKIIACSSETGQTKVTHQLAYVSR